jgi:hypothetical protein
MHERLYIRCPLLLVQRAIERKVAACAGFQDADHLLVNWPKLGTACLGYLGETDRVAAPPVKRMAWGHDF